jgi:hypothetical protein
MKKLSAGFKKNCRDSAQKKVYVKSAKLRS